MEKAVHLTASSFDDIAWYWWGDFEGGVRYTRPHSARVAALMRLPRNGIVKVY